MAADQITQFTPADDEASETVGLLVPGLETQSEADSKVEDRIQDLRRSHEELVVVATNRSLARLIAAVSEWIASSSDERESLIEAMLPRQQVVTVAAAEQAQRNAAARQELLEEFEVYDSEGVAHVVGSTAANRSQAASRLLKNGRIFGVMHRGQRLFPSWQFGPSGSPLPVIAQVLRQARRLNLDGWEIALWFTSENGWLDDSRPVDFLTRDPDAVAQAAQNSFDELVG